eukprot:403341725
MSQQFSQSLKPRPQINFQQIIRNNLADKHGRFDFYYSKAVDKIVKDAPNQRIVAVFKDYLIYDDASCECLRKSYPIDESHDKLKKLCEFYTDYADIFPTYALLLQPCQDEMTLILKDKEGMAKYMYKNIRRKQRMIDEMYSIVEKNKLKNQNNPNLQFEKKHQVKKGEKRHGRNAKNMNKVLFTPSFFNSVIRFEQNLAKRERIIYLKKLAFGTSMGEMLDQFIEKDTQQVSYQENFYCGRVIEPLHLVDNIFHLELERNKQKVQLTKAQNSRSRSKSPMNSENRQWQRIKQGKSPTVIDEAVLKIQPNQVFQYSYRQHISPNGRQKQAAPISCLPQNMRIPREFGGNQKALPSLSSQKQKTPSLSPNQKSTRKSISPSIQQNRSPIRTSIQKRSPMRNIVNQNMKQDASPRLQQNHQMLRNKITPVKELGKPPSNMRPSHSPQINPQSQFNKTTSLMLGQSIKLLLKANKNKTNLMDTQILPTNLKSINNTTSAYQLSHSKLKSGFNSHRKENQTSSMQFETPSKNLIRTRDISGSKGRMQLSDRKQFEPTNINLRMMNPFSIEESSKVLHEEFKTAQYGAALIQSQEDGEVEDSHIQDNSRIMELKNTAASKIRESLIKKPVTKSNNLRTHAKSLQVQVLDIDQVISINIMNQEVHKNNM